MSERQRRGLWGLPRDNNFNFENFKLPSIKNAGQQRLEASVEVTYNQISTYRTAVLELYNAW